VTAHLPWTELAERMSRADVFVFPSLAEGSARVVFMAMACGCYVITTPNSGSVVQEGVNGRIIAPGDVEELEAALRRIVSNADQVPVVGRRNADLIKSQYTQSHYGKGLIAIYKALMAERCVPGGWTEGEALACSFLATNDDGQMVCSP
jgi:glycosyltransferase involved in cell wall biosynthesis